MTKAKSSVYVCVKACLVRDGFEYTSEQKGLLEVPPPHRPPAWLAPPPRRHTNQHGLWLTSAHCSLASCPLGPPARPQVGQRIEALESRTTEDERVRVRFMYGHGEESEEGWVNLCSKE